METYIGGAIAAFGLFQIGAVFALIYKRNDLADVLWGLGFPIAAAGGFVGQWFGGREPQPGAIEFVILAMISVWALRLSFYVGLRYFKKGHEDQRYAKWRREWGATWLWRSYLQVWILQPLILYMIVAAVLYALEHAPKEFTALTAVGAAIWFIGFAFEVIGDDQLRRFSKDPANKGKIMDRGLWAWTRHPNYFGESAMWWGIFLMAGGWWTMISPITMTVLITKVSGVSMLEEIMRQRPGWQEYENRVSVFIPWPPKRP